MTGGSAGVARMVVRRRSLLLGLFLGGLRCHNAMGRLVVGKTAVLVALGAATLSPEMADEGVLNSPGDMVVPEGALAFVVLTARIAVREPPGAD